MAEPAEEFLTWARQALEDFGLPEATPTFIGQSENVTFRVENEDTGEQYLLRLHKPLTQNFLGIRQQPRAIESELEWLEALGRDTAIGVPQPVRNRAGQLVITVTAADYNRTPCTLFRWREGVPLEVNSPEAPELVKQLGALLAQLHQHAGTWKTPNDFLRPTYGADYLIQVVSQLHAGVEMGIVREQDHAIIQRTLENVASLVLRLDLNPENWGLNHNDLHPGNCLVWEGRLYPIDFSMCGFGYYVFDIGTCLGSLPVALRQPFLHGYLSRRPLPTNYLRLVEGCLILSRMSYYALILPNPSAQARLKSRIPQVVESVCQKFLSGEYFLFDVR
jgi:Ser/Thr protein kinase RdoA (MazF antagonist)